MTDDNDRVVFLEFVNQLFNAGGGNRVKRRARFVKQQYLRLHGDAASNAQTLLLAAGERGAGLSELILHIVPERRLAQRPFNALIQIGFSDLFAQTHTVRHVVVNRHGERRRTLKNHAHAAAQRRHVDRRIQNFKITHADGAFGSLLRIQILHTVQTPQKRRFAAAGRSDEGRYAPFGNGQRNVLQRVKVAVVDVKVGDQNLGFGHFTNGKLIEMFGMNQRHLKLFNMFCSLEDRPHQRRRRSRMTMAAELMRSTRIKSTSAVPYCSGRVASMLVPEVAST